ncbi:MAG: hypothetical protein JW834_02140 [Candidatus Diapherotrites archaeon]|nr:hypothetical protein [Candidatus Diapherotrites archaeon]
MKGQGSINLATIIMGLIGCACLLAVILALLNPAWSTTNSTNLRVIEFKLTKPSPQNYSLTLANTQGMTLELKQVMIKGNNLTVVHDSVGLRIPPGGNIRMEETLANAVYDGAEGENYEVTISVTYKKAETGLESTEAGTLRGRLI